VWIGLEDCNAEITLKAHDQFHVVLHDDQALVASVEALAEWALIDKLVRLVLWLTNWDGRSHKRARAAPRCGS